MSTIVPKSEQEVKGLTGCSLSRRGWFQVQGPTCYERSILNIMLHYNVDLLPKGKPPIKTIVVFPQIILRSHIVAFSPILIRAVCHVHLSDCISARSRNTSGTSSFHNGLLSLVTLSVGLDVVFRYYFVAFLLENKAVISWNIRSYLVTLSLSRPVLDFVPRCVKRLDSASL